MSYLKGYPPPYPAVPPKKVVIQPPSKPRMKPTILGEYNGLDDNKTNDMRHVLDVILICLLIIICGLVYIIIKLQ